MCTNCVQPRGTWSKTLACARKPRNSAFQSRAAQGPTPNNGVEGHKKVREAVNSPHVRNSRTAFLLTSSARAAQQEQADRSGTYRVCTNKECGAKEGNSGRSGGKQGVDWSEETDSGKPKRTRRRRCSQVAGRPTRRMFGFCLFSVWSSVGNGLASHSHLGLRTSSDPLSFLGSSAHALPAQKSIPKGAKSPRKSQRWIRS